MNARVVTTQYYGEKIDKVKRDGRVQMTKSCVTNSNWHPTELRKWQKKSYDDMDMMLFEKYVAKKY